MKHLTKITLLLLAVFLIVPFSDVDAQKRKRKKEKESAPKQSVLLLMFMAEVDTQLYCMELMAHQCQEVEQVCLE